MARLVGHSTTRFKSARTVLGSVTAILVFVTMSGCGLLGGSAPSSSPDVGRSGTVEKSKIRLGTMPIVDVAPVHIAIKKGYFKQEGLDVELTTIQGGSAGIPGLISGDLDFTFGNWVSFFTAESKGAAKGVDGIKLVSDGYQGKSNMFLILAAAGSPLKGAKDLAGKTIAINTFKNITELAARATLEASAVDSNSVTFKEMPFPAMQAALANKQVDAALMVEPFITAAERTAGMIPVLDTVSGPTDNLPIAGYGITGKFAKENPKTVAAFQRAMSKAQQDAAQRPAVEELLSSYAKIDSETASLVHFGVYPTSLDATRLQRVADLMKTYGMLDEKMDVKAMLIRGPVG